MKLNNLKLYDSLQKRVVDFQPREAGKIGMYVCGMTVYDLCHLGHARAFINFDSIVRFLRWAGWQVTFVRNITDVDDKILNRARETGQPWQRVVETNIAAMEQDFASLGMQVPDQQPRATQHIEAIVAMVETLVDRGYAYRGGNGDYYYRIKHFADYGKLSGRNPDELLSGARVEVDPNKEDPRDFALWKAVSAEETGWDTGLGRGRPGWHIECSAMSKSCLGDTFDIHGGGPDLRFPHHENEIAQSEAANGCVYANYWLHAGPLRIDGEKMSKSLGNFFTIREVLKQYHPEVIRFFVLSSHYRSEINYSTESLDEAKRSLDRFYHALRGVESKAAPEQAESERLLQFAEAMNDDFNTRQALTLMGGAVDELNQAKIAGDAQGAAQLVAQLREMGLVLGLLALPAEQYLKDVRGDSPGVPAEEVEALIEERQQAKLQKNYQRADEIREQLASQGIQLDDSREGTSWRRV